MLYNAPDPLPYSFNHRSVFIAGGISGCPFWQNDVIQLFDLQIYDVVNPRRPYQIELIGGVAEEQIAWEYRALNLVDACVFWFPKETVAPITLFELGKMLERAVHHSTQLVIGWHPEYSRAFDLQVQISLACSANEHVIFGPGWDEFCQNIKKTWT